MTATARVMGPSHERWREFADRLGGPEGCDFREQEGRDVWDCDQDHRRTRAILTDMGFDAEGIEAGVTGLIGRAGYCDCMVLLNVDDGTYDHEAPDGQGGLGGNPTSAGTGTVGGLRVRKSRRRGA